LIGSIKANRAEPDRRIGPIPPEPFWHLFAPGVVAEAKPVL